LGWFDFAQVPIDFSLYFAMDFGLEQPPRTSYADLSSYIPNMSHLSTITNTYLLCLGVIGKGPAKSKLHL
jgi:hypothetical protein